MQARIPLMGVAVAITALFLVGCAVSPARDGPSPTSLVKVQCTTSSATDLGPCQGRADQLCEGAARLRGIESRTDAGNAGAAGKYQLYHISASYECVKAGA